MEMPYTALQAFDIGTDDFGSIYIISEGNEYSAAVAQSALSLLDSRHQTQGKRCISDAGIQRTDGTD